MSGQTRACPAATGRHRQLPGTIIIFPIYQICYQGQQKCYKHQLKTNMKKCKIDTTSGKLTVKIAVIAHV